MKILLLSRYGRLGASSRVRLLQFIHFFESKGWDVDVRPLFSDNYLRALYSGRSRIVTIFWGYWYRLISLKKIREYDLIWIEKEIFPFFPSWIECLLAKMGISYVVDYDDALFHRYDKHSSWYIRLILGHKIDAVMKHATLVIAGNEYLAERARATGGGRVEIIPTVVDLTRYKPIQSVKNLPLVVGWIGSPATSRYLSIVSPAFELLKRDCDVRFVAVGAKEDTVNGMPVEVWPWSEETEVESIQAFDIGIMPIEDSPWERGKCGYKLIQYMACGIPVVASPVGVNREIVEHGANGYLAKDLHEWEQALRGLLDDRGLRRRMGAKGREQIEAWYSLQVQAPRLEALMRGVLR